MIQPEKIEQHIIFLSCVLYSRSIQNSKNKYIYLYINIRLILNVLICYVSGMRLRDCIRNLFLSNDLPRKYETRSSNNDEFSTSKIQASYSYLYYNNYYLSTA